MKLRLLQILACPHCQSELDLIQRSEDRGEIRSGRLTCRGCRRDYEIRDFVPRFVPPGNYAQSFGLQWNLFRKTQLDSHSGHPISRDRFLGFTGWSPEDLSGQLTLDVGCGAGRFAEVALSCGAEVVAIDYSAAVDACQANLGAHPNLHVVQADIYRLPFHPASFQRVYCLGVLQHTPDVRQAFLQLPRQLQPGGRMAVDVYPWLWRCLFWMKYWLRPFTRGMPHPRLMRLVEGLVEWLLPVSRAIARMPVIGHKLSFCLPVANYETILPLSLEQIRLWALLDTFDMLAPAYDKPQTLRTLRGWLEEAGLIDIEVLRRGFLIARGSHA